MENDKLKLRKYDNQKNRNLQCREFYQIPESNLQIHEIDSKTRYLDQDETIDIIYDWNNQMIELLENYKKNKKNQNNIQDIRNLYNEIFYDISDNQSCIYRGISPYKVILDENIKIISDYLNLLKDNSEANKEFVENFNKNFNSLKEISDIYLEKDFFFTSNPTHKIENDVDEQTKTNFIKAKENKILHQKIIIDDKKLNTKNNKKDRKIYLDIKNDELSKMEQNSENQNGTVIFNDTVDQSEITHIPIKEPSEKLNLDKKPTKSILKKDIRI